MSKLRPQQHEIDDAACRLFEQSLPREWVYRPLPKDYGIDGEVEVFRDRKSTGIIFKVQIKGTESPRLLSDGRIISFSLGVDDVSYYLDEVTIPVFLMLVDVNDSRVYWHAIQLDNDLARELRKAQVNRAGSVTVHIKTRNEIEKTRLEIVKKTQEAVLVIAFRSVSAATGHELLDTLSSMGSLTPALEGLKRGTSYARFALLQQAWHEGRIEDVKRTIREVLRDPDSELSTVVAARGMAELIAIQGYRSVGRADLVPLVELRFAARLRAMCRDGDVALRFHAAMKRRLALLHAAVDRDFGLFMSTKVHETQAARDSADPLWGMLLSPARMDAAQRVLIQHHKCMRLMEWAVRSGLAYVAAKETVGILFSMSTFLVRLRSEDLHTAADFWEEQLEGLVSFSLEVAAKSEEWDLAALLIGSALHLADPTSDARLEQRRRWCHEQADRIDDPDVRDNLHSSLDEVFETARRLLRRPVPTEPSLEEERQMIREMARAQGIDLDDPDDLVARIVRIGLTDLDPTRVLKHCKHLFLAQGSYGLPAKTLGLPSAGSKTLWCTLHSYGIGGMELDSLYEEFMQREHCTECRDAQPHPEGWAWTRDWQAKQHQVYGDRFRGL